MKKFLFSRVVNASVDADVYYDDNGWLEKGSVIPCEKLYDIDLHCEQDDIPSGSQFEPLEKLSDAKPCKFNLLTREPKEKNLHMIDINILCSRLDIYEVEAKTQEEAYQLLIKSSAYTSGLRKYEIASHYYDIDDGAVVTSAEVVSFLLM